MNRTQSRLLLQGWSPLKLVGDLCKMPWYLLLLYRCVYMYSDDMDTKWIKTFTHSKYFTRATLPLPFAVKQTLCPQPLVKNCWPVVDWWRERFNITYFSRGNLITCKRVFNNSKGDVAMAPAAPATLWEDWVFTRHSVDRFTHPPMKKWNTGLISVPPLIANLTIITVRVGPTSTEENKPGADVLGAPQKYLHSSQKDNDNAQRQPRGNTQFVDASNPRRRRSHVNT